VTGGSFLERLRGMREGRPRLGPETLHLDVTNACNLDCITCWNYAPDLATPKSPSWKRQRMDSALFDRMVDEAIVTGVERVVISGGGEPFTHPDIYRFIERVKERGLRLTIITNGTLCDYDRLKGVRVDQILLNIASATPKTYVRYHPNQTEETFHRLCAGALRLREVTAVNLVQVINRVNFEEIPQMAHLAHTLGARSSFKVGDAPRGTERYSLSPDEVRLVLAELVPRARAIAKRLGVRHNLDAFAAQLGGEGLSGEQTGCFAGYLYSRVYVDGRVFFCCEHIDVGHASEGTFAQIWSGPRYAAMRERLRRREFFPGCARCGKHDMNFQAARAMEELVAAGDLE
jgi:MoaA/NifB/PqqE/SkfB family radical SAM enzyme